MIGLKRKKPLTAPTKKPIIANSSAAKNSFHDSFVPLSANSNNGKSCSRVKKIADGCPITVAPYDDEMDNKLALRSVSSSSSLHGVNSVRFRKHFSGSQLLKPFPGSRASSASSSRGMIKFDLTVKSTLLTDTQKDFIQLDSDDDVDDDFEVTEEISFQKSTNIERSAPSSSSSPRTSGTRDFTNHSGKPITERGQGDFKSYDKSHAKSNNRDDCIYIDSTDSKIESSRAKKKDCDSTFDPGSFQADHDHDHDVYDTSSPIKTFYNYDDDTLVDNLEDTPPRQSRSKELPTRCTDSRTKDVPPSQGTGRLHRSALKMDQNDTTTSDSRLSSKSVPNKYGIHSSSSPSYASGGENLVDSDDDCAANSRMKVSRASSNNNIEKEVTTWTCKSCTLENSVRDEMCTACMQHQADNKIHDLHSIEDTPIHSKERSKSRKSGGQADIADQHLGVNSSSSSSSSRSGRKQVSLVVKKDKTSSERARSVWMCSWCKAENGMRRMKCELCSQRRVTEENVNDRSSEGESQSEGSDDEDEDEDDGTIEDGNGSGSGEEGVSDFDEEYQKDKKKRKTTTKDLKTKTSASSSSSSSSSSKKKNSSSSSSSSSNRKLDSDKDKGTVTLKDSKSKRESDVTEKKRKDLVDSDEEEDTVDLFDEHRKYDRKKRKSAGKGDKAVKVSTAAKKSRVEKKEVKVIEIDDKDETEEDEGEKEGEGEGEKEGSVQGTKKSVKEGMKDRKKPDLASSDDDDRKFLFNMSDDTDEQEEEEEEDSAEEEDDERGAGSQAFENYFSQRQSPPVRSKASSRTDNGRNTNNENKVSSLQNDITISDDDDDDDGMNPPGGALSSSRRLGLTASKGRDSRVCMGSSSSSSRGGAGGRVSDLLDLTGGGSGSDGLDSDDSPTHRNSSANRSSSSHAASNRAVGDRHSTDRDRDRGRDRDRDFERDRGRVLERDRDMGGELKRKRNSAINIDDIEGDSEDDEDDLFSSAMFRNKGSKDKGKDSGGRREGAFSRAEPGPTHPDITPHFW